MKITLTFSRSLLVLAFILVAGISIAQRPYWQQRVDCTIDVTLDDSAHTLDGFLKVIYTNNSPDTLRFIWFHIWPNAYKNDHTAFSEQLLQLRRTDFYFSPKEQKGYINRLDFRSDNNSLLTDEHPEFIDAVRVNLGKPLFPRSTVEITTPFHVQLPNNFSRSGHAGQSYLVTQWYPRPALYDGEGWNILPYLHQGEFYNDFGTFDVRITLPSDYLVAATGMLQDEPEKEWLRARAAGRVALEQFEQEIVAGQAIKKKNHGDKIVAVTSPTRPPKTIHYIQDNVSDFAWFADKNFLLLQDTIMLNSGKQITANVFFTKEDMHFWKSSMAYVKNAVRTRSTLLGDYPYPAISVVETKIGFEGGMEYPMITSISPASDSSLLETVIEHEIGHNWFQAALGSNERKYPWMDEGMNTYYDDRYFNSVKPVVRSPWIQKRIPPHQENFVLDILIAQKKDQPVNTPSEAFTAYNYNLVGYTKASLWMQLLEKELTTAVFDAAMKNYYEVWKFRHPGPSDFKQSIEAASGKNLDSLFALLQSSGDLFSRKFHKKIKPVFFYSVNDYKSIHYINILPVGGYNLYDGVMAGLMIHNYNLPPSSFRFVAIPLYGLASKKVEGIGRISYTTYYNDNKKWVASITASRFSNVSASDSNTHRITGGFSKIVPAFRWQFKNHSPLSTVTKFLEFKSYHIRERGFNYILNTTDSFYYPVPASATYRYLNEALFFLTDRRILYPYDVHLQVQQGKGFYRASVIANYLFNYSDGGGMRVRGFAAKFGYIGGRTPAHESNGILFQPKLTAVRGYEDYTYSNYFIGRDEQNGLPGQQFMLRDGALKLRTDLFQGLQGRSDNWVTAINFSSSLPRDLFPIKIPFRLFLDVGTYAEAWEKNASTSRLLYVAGLQLSLFKNLLNIYAPVVFSKEFRDNLKTVPEQNTFFKRISFSIDIHLFNILSLTEDKFPIQ